MMSELDTIALWLSLAREEVRLATRKGQFPQTIYLGIFGLVLRGRLVLPALDWLSPTFGTVRT